VCVRNNRKILEIKKSLEENSEQHEAFFREVRFSFSHPHLLPPTHTDTHAHLRAALSWTRHRTDSKWWPSTLGGASSRTCPVATTSPPAPHLSDAGVPLETVVSSINGQKERSCTQHRPHGGVGVPKLGRQP
jgi:hypothetical protein